MHSLPCLSPYNKQPLSLPQLSLFTSNRPITLISLWLPGGDVHVFKKANKNQSHSLTSCIVHAVGKDSQQYEIDPDKAKEALKELDQQLQDLSKKQVSPPKIKASDVKLTSNQMTEEVWEFSGSGLVYATIFLFLFSIFYNILFYTVIKPSIDGPEPGTTLATTTTTTTTTMERGSPKVTVLQLLPLTPEVFVQHYGGSY